MAERITFETLRNAAYSKQILAQQLLIPISIDLSPAAMEVLPEHLPTFHTLGFDLEIFGPQTVILKSHPANLKNFNSETTVKELVEQVISEFQPQALEQEMDKLLSLIACKNSIRAKDYLNSETITQFFRQLDELQVGLTCPHGRPFVKELAKGEIENWFHR
jgi:DNA mismatch repair protein MutL